MNIPMGNKVDMDSIRMGSGKGQKPFSLLVNPRFFRAFLFLIFFLILEVGFFVSYNHYQMAIRETIQTNRSVPNLLSELILEKPKRATTILQSYSYHPLLIHAAEKNDFEETVKHLAILKENNQQIDYFDLVVSNLRS